MLQLVRVMSDQCLGSLVSFISGILLARACNKQEFGIYVLAFSLIVVVLGIQRALITGPFTLSNNEFHRRHLIDYRKSITLFQAGVTILTLVAGCFVALTTKISGVGFSLGMLFLGALAAQMWYFFLKESLLAERKIEINFNIGLGINLPLLAGMGGMFWLGLLSVKVYFAGLVIMVLLPVIFLVKKYMWLSTGNISRRGLLYFARKNWKIGRWTIGATLLFSLVSQIYPWILAAHFGAAEVAILGIVCGASRLFNPIPQGLGSFFLPKLSGLRRSPAQYWRAFILLAGICIAAATLLLAAGYFMGDWLIVLFYSEKYSGLGLYAFWAFADQALVILSLPIDILANSCKRTDLVFKATIMRTAVMAVVGIYLTVHFSVLGALLAIVIDRLSGQLFIAWAMRKYFFSDKPA